MLLQIVLVVLTPSVILGQNACIHQTSCSGCLGESPFCGWCLDPTFGGVRCNDARDLASSGCSEISVQQPHETRIVRNLPHSNRRVARPQVIESQFHKNQTVSFQISTRVPDDNSAASSVSVRVAVAADSPVSVRITVDCNSAPQTRSNRMMCRAVAPGEEVNFKVTATLNECITEPWELLVYTRIGRLRGLTKINIRSICECECEESRLLPGSTDDYCYRGGQLICGQCECNADRYGKRCECEGGANQLPNPCVPPDQNTTAPCSGRGQCVCGMCECEFTRFSAERYSGAYCECDDSACPMYHGQLCGGPGRGVCQCGTCRCELGFTGPDCSCPESIETCVSTNGMVCNGHGDCVCGRCACDPDSHYRGIRCEDCPTCPDQCHLHKDCVECMGFGIGRISREECLQRCMHSTIFMVDRVQGENDDEGTACRYTNPDGCMYEFRYQHGSGIVAVKRTMVQQNCDVVSLIKSIQPYAGLTVRPSVRSATSPVVDSFIYPFI
ncbi:hypothetical protein ScPMuIL_004244 [Solemya velum]